jgi:hypothetical protein
MAIRTQMTYQVAIVPSATRTRVLVSDGPDELLRAILPPVSRLHVRAVVTFLEGLSLWLNAKLHVVLCADAGAEHSLGLTDELGVGVRSLFFDVEVRDRAMRRRRGRRIRGIGDFVDVRQLRLVVDDA